tara:strand:- start:295 stop:474 length:180 start_codon:yes stop_codon:yes gene_type:complete
MDRKYNISEILDAVNEIHSSGPKKKRDEKTLNVSKKISEDDIPSNTLNLIEEAERNLKN